MAATARVQEERFSDQRLEELLQDLHSLEKA
jgi:hypothetical protein